MNICLLREKRVFEIMLIALILGMTTLFYVLDRHGMLALHLFFLPVILCGYFLGRLSAGILSLFSVLTVTIAATVLAPRFQGYDTPVTIGLALAMWAAALGMTALLMGTLCDERAKTLDELHRAYVGVVEVLFKYLQSSNPRIKARSIMIAELSEATALEMRFSRKQADDIRVAALLRDLESVEVTTQMISRAVDTLESSSTRQAKTFMGTDLVHSLGAVLDGALPLIVGQNEDVRECLSDGCAVDVSSPMGAEIISTVRSYVRLTSDESRHAESTPKEAINHLRREGRPEPVLQAIVRAVDRTNAASTTGKLEYQSA